MSNSSGPRVAFLLSSLRFGGGERVAVNLAEALRAQGYAIDFVLMRSEGELLAEVLSRFNVIDLRCTRTWRLPWLLASYLRASRPDALISSFWKLNLCACLARIASPATRLAVWEHSPPSRSRNSPTWQYAITASILYRLATRVVTVSNGVGDDVRRITRGLASRVITIYNAVPAALNEDLPRHRQGRRVLWVGRLDDPKNPGLIIDAMARLPEHSRAILFMLGEGVQRPELEARVRNEGLRGRIRLLGFQSNPLRTMALADLLVLTSDREGLPTVLIEALLTGLAVVSTDCAAGVHEILNDGDFGAIVPIRDPEALAAVIVQQLANPPSRSHQRSGAVRFDPATIANQFVVELGISPAS